MPAATRTAGCLPRWLPSALGQGRSPHWWHLGLNNSLLWGTVLCFVGCSFLCLHPEDASSNTSCHNQKYLPTWLNVLCGGHYCPRLKTPVLSHKPGFQSQFEHQVPRPTSVSACWPHPCLPRGLWRGPQSPTHLVIIHPVLAGSCSPAHLLHAEVTGQEGTPGSCPASTASCPFS